MAVNYNNKKGVHLASWHWLNQTPLGSSNPGTSNNYDGVRYIYWLIQRGSSTAASTTDLLRFDTWTNGWQYLGSSPTSGFSGAEMEYDPVRNVIYFSIGNNATTNYFFNLNTAAITIGGVTAQPYAFSGTLPALPAAANTWAALDHASDGDLAQFLTVRGQTADRTTGVVAAGSTTTSISDTTAEFHDGLKGCYVRFITGTLTGQSRVITATTLTTLTVTALGGAPAAGDTFVVEVPGSRPTPITDPANGLAATGGSTTTLVATGSAWPVNVYRDADVLIVAGTGSGQRRRIASNTIDTLTLAGAVAGNARTGPFATAPDATSRFRIVPSEDFLYYSTTTQALYRADVAATTLTWVAQTAPPAVFGVGGQVMRTPSFAPFSIVATRGANTNTAWRYDIGLQTWATLTTLWGAELLTTGATTVRMPGRHRFIINIGATQRLYIWNPVVGTLEPITFLPYTAPSGYDGKRLRYIRTADGVEFLYALRAGGQEFFRLPMTWLD